MEIRPFKPLSAIGRGNRVTEFAMPRCCKVNEYGNRRLRLWQAEKFLSQRGFGAEKFLSSRSQLRAAASAPAPAFFQQQHSAQHRSRLLISYYQCVTLIALSPIPSMQGG